jgi:phosphoglycolate phosphatase
MLAPVIVFDLDGTLVDTAPDLVSTLNVVFERIGLPPVDYATARNLVGGGARKMIERGLATEGRTVAAAEVDDLTRQFIEHYAEHIADRSHIFPGVETALTQLAAKGCRLAVCTNKLEWLAARLLHKLNLAHLFVVVSGGDTYKLQKPHPEPLRRTIARAGGSDGQAVMVGDSIVDIATGRAAGIPVIAVDFGYSETPVSELGPARVISAFAELPEAVFELFDGRSS